MPSARCPRPCAPRGSGGEPRYCACAARRSIRRFCVRLPREHVGRGHGAGEVPPERGPVANGRSWSRRFRRRWQAAWRRPGMASPGRIADGPGKSLPHRKCITYEPHRWRVRRRLAWRHRRPRRTRRRVVALRRLYLLKHHRERAWQQLPVVDHANPNERTELAKCPTHVARAIRLGHELSPARAPRSVARLYDDTQFQRREMLLTADVLAKGCDDFDLERIPGAFG